MTMAQAPGMSHAGSKQACYTMIAFINASRGSE